MSLPPRPLVIEVHVRVLGCLAPGLLTLEIVPDRTPGAPVSLIDGVPGQIATERVPFDLRLPNTEFLLVLDGWDSVVAVRRLPARSA